MPSPQIERKLAAIMFTDIAGYTESMSKSESKTLNLLEKKRSILKPLLKEYKGTFVKEIGDGTLSYFESAVNAATCAVKLQEITYDDKDMNIRVGIHIGDIVFKDGDVFGGGVNVASRLESIAPAGGVCVSKSVYDELSNQDDFDGIELGLQSLKGVGRLIEVFGLKGEKLNEPNPEKYQENKVAIHSDDEVPSIAIIPFRNKGKDEDIFYAYGISADLITDCSKASHIRIESLDNIEKIEGLNKLKAEELAEKLLVRYIATGSLWKMGDMFQLSVELYDTKDKKIVWSDRWQEEWENLYAIKGNISDGILKTLLASHQDENIIKISHPEAYEYYLRAQYKWTNRKDKEDIEIAIGLLYKAIDIDDKLLIAKKLLGIAYRQEGKYEKAMEIFKGTLKQAKELDDMYGVQWSFGNIGAIFYGKGKFDKAIKWYNYAFEVSKNLETRLDDYHYYWDMGLVYRDTGEYKKALEYFNKSLDINTKYNNDRGIAGSLLQIGIVFHIKRNFEKASEYLHRSLEIARKLNYKDQMGAVYNSLGGMHRKKGEYGKALEYYNLSLNVFKDLNMKRGIAGMLNNISSIYSHKGNYEKGLKLCNRSLIIIEEIGDNYSKGLVYGKIGASYWELGKYDIALEYYSKSIELRNKIGNKKGLLISFAQVGALYIDNNNYKKAEEYLQKSLHLLDELGLPSDSTLWIIINLYIAYKQLGREYNKKEVYKLLNDNNGTWDGANFDLYYRLYILLEETSYIETAYNEVQEKADNLEPDVAAKFLSYPIPKAIVEDWERVK